MAELHIIGQISSAKNFEQPHLFCKWSFHTGGGWKLISGNIEGQTQECCDSYTESPVFDHPLDLHYTTQTLQGSPKLLLQIFCRDNHSRILFVAYGVSTIPLTPGFHSIECYTWKPIGDWQDRLRDKFLDDITMPSCLDESQCNNTTNLDNNIKSTTEETNLPSTKSTSGVTKVTSTEFSNSKGVTVTTISPQNVSTTTASNTNLTNANNSLLTNLEMMKFNVHKTHVELCECDMTTFSCDINCCCDVDCKESQVAVFSRCTDHRTKIYDSRYCYENNFVQYNNTGYILERLANNLFCIVYDNLPPTYSASITLDVQTHKALKDVIDGLDTSQFKWQSQKVRMAPEFNNTHPYRHGDILWKVDDGFIKQLEVLQSGFTSLCSFKKTLRYLEDWNSACMQTDLTNNNVYLFPKSFHKFTVIASPLLFNESYIISQNQSCPKNVCLALENRYCMGSWDACNNTEILTGYCANGACINIVTHVRYVIIHNGTLGIQRIRADLQLGNVSEKFYQHYEISYEWVNLNKNKSFKLSGNPGYLIGKPIVIGTLITNKTNDIDTKYVLANRKNHFLTMPIGQRNGECDPSNRYLVGFGEDVKLKCSVTLTTNNFTKESCIELQNRTLETMLESTMYNITQVDQYNMFVSKLGYIHENGTSSWAQILLDRVPHNVITGQVVNDRIQCSGLVTSLRADILHALLPKQRIMNNHKILGISFTFSEEVDLSWSKCAGNNCMDTLVIDIVTYIAFHDASKPLKYYFAGGPNFDITLPYDFFYPFMSGTANINSPYPVSIFLITSMIINSMYP
ncbi:tectonic-3 [Cephus cinctus]|uniref:Tectonic-3 n=1 Tax=Cephus cinctus TaxID=211228 RepID=A0AAJ7RM10_CEPCN|nr:tectonic-3 [Cephus cinctus]XP_024942932.1 tectonic-3 [Cephus cinctus]